jgi:polysaccharide chain length determinant protein (PEP-CTERM system associated)
MEEAYQFTLRDYFDVARRRWLQFLVPFVLVAAAAVAVALWLPPIYKSQGTILIESQQIPTDLIRSTVTSYADERIQVIQQLVMTRENLLRIIEKYDVLGDRRNELAVSEQVDLVRQRIAVSKLAGEFASQRNRTTIAFTVSYEDPQPGRAYSVTNELVTLFLEENVKARTARASETTEFLGDEAEKLRRALERIEEQIALYKQENGDALPEHLDLHMGMLERTEAAIKQTELDVNSAQDELRFLQIERNAVKSGVVVEDDSQPVLSAPQELARAEAALDRLRGKYSEQHPDMRRQLALVERLRATADSIDTVTDANPGSPATEPLPVPENLGLARVDARISSTEERIAALRARIEDLVQRRTELEEIIIRTPQVQRALTSLSRDYENTERKYKEIQAKEMEARLAESLEEGRKAERFSLIEPPLRPERPDKPNRRKIALLGIILAGGVAFMLVALLELLDHRVRGVTAMTRLFGDRPLVVIPYIPTQGELERRRQLQWGALGGAGAACLLALIALHFLYQPLDMLMIKIMARLG